MVYQIQNAYKSFGNKCILQNVSFDFSHAGLYVITGKSGNGKSTLLNILAGFERLDQGEIINDENLKISYIFQNFELIDDLTIEDNICITENLFNFEYQDKENILLKLDINHLLKHYPYELSFGQKQRVGIARAIISDADVYLCDEPTESLDQSHIDDVMEILYELSKIKIVIIVTHNRSVIKQQDITLIHLHDGLLEPITSINFAHSVIKSQQKTYDVFKLQQYIHSFIQKNTKRQMNMMMFFIVIMISLSFLYMFIFPPRSYEKTINHHVIFVETSQEIKDGIPTLSFLDFDTNTQYIPIHAEPILEFNESLEVIGQKDIHKDQIMINQNMAHLLKNLWGLDAQELLSKELSLQCQTNEGPLTFNFQIAAIVNEDDAGAYSKIYYDKPTLDTLLKHTPYQTQSLYDYVYDKTHFAIISSKDKFKKVYQDYSDFPLFNIELTQEEIIHQQTSSYKFYFVIFFIIVFILQIIFMIYNCFKDWKYHLGTFAILLTLGAKVNDIKKIYINDKIRYLLFYLCCFVIFNALFSIFFHSYKHFIIITSYLFSLLIIFVIVIFLTVRHFQYEDIADILKNDKEIR